MDETGDHHVKSNKPGSDVTEVTSFLSYMKDRSKRQTYIPI
jgi:hypothetical protein